MVNNEKLPKNYAKSFGGGFYTAIVNASNLLVASNSSGMYISSGETNKVTNSIFFGNNNSDINGDSSAIISNLDNNYIYLNTISLFNVASNNIYDGVNLGFVDEANGDYNLTDTSDLINAGTTTVTGFTLPTTDLNGNTRVLGSSIDIGPYEFSIATKPIIKSFTYTGTAETLSELTFSVDYNLTDSRTVNNVEYDYLNDGNLTTINTHIFNTAGTYIVKVIVTDSEGESSTTSLPVVVTAPPLTFSEMTNEQKLTIAINPTYYDDIVALINAEKTASNTSGYTLGFFNGKLEVVNHPTDFNLTNATSVVEATATGISTGKQYVKDNLSEFNLTTIASMNTAVTEMNVTATAIGREQVIDNPSSFGIEITTPLSSSDITALTDSWSMISIPTMVTDMSVFFSAKVVWYYNHGVWNAYSSDASMASAITQAGIATITSLPAGSGIWVNK